MTNNIQTPQQKASAKFKRYGTQLNELEQQKIDQHLILIGSNQNAFIKKLIMDEINSHSMGLFQRIRYCIFN